MNNESMPKEIWAGTDKKGSFWLDHNPMEGSRWDDAKYIRADLVPQWQPIETAPKDGTWVLLCNGATDEDREDDDFGKILRSRPVTAFWDKGDWVFSHWDGAWRSCYSCPTHWMPLPQPPKGQDDG